MTRASHLINLEKLGPRICIIGPSSSGKSTLAHRLSQKMECPVLHLDQLAHVPGTAWQRRPDAETVAEHDAFIAGDTWVVEGNYSVCMKQRFTRATSVIWLDPPLWGFLYRYIKRSLMNDKHRYGRLANAKNEFSFKLIRYTFINYPKNRKRYHQLLSDTDMTPIIIRSMRALNRFMADQKA